MFNGFSEIDSDPAKFDFWETINVKTKIGKVETNSLIDCGCGKNLIFKSTWEKLGIRNSELKLTNDRIVGLGNQSLKILYKVNLTLSIHGLKMKECEFLVVEDEKGLNDIILGYNFLKENNIRIHARRLMIEIKVDEKQRNELYINKKGETTENIVAGYGVYAAETINLRKFTFRSRRKSM